MLDFFCKFCHSFMKLNTVAEEIQCTNCDYTVDIKNNCIYSEVLIAQKEEDINTEIENNEKILELESYRRIFIKCKQCDYDIAIFKTNDDMKSETQCLQCNHRETTLNDS